MGIGGVVRNRNLVEGMVGIVLGGGLTINGLLSGAPARAGSSAYAMGEFAALIFGVVFLVAGLYYLRKGLRERSR